MAAPAVLDALKINLFIEGLNIDPMSRHFGRVMNIINVMAGEAFAFAPAVRVVTRCNGKTISAGSKFSIIFINRF
jgi:hypothetical protein